MKIAMMTNNYKPFVGGVPISVERLAEGLRMRGHEVCIFAPDYGTYEDERDVVRIKTCKKTLTSGMAVPNIWDRRIGEEFEYRDFDLIHVHQPMLVGNLALHMSRKYQIPLVYTYHTQYGEYLHHIPFLERKERLTDIVKTVLPLYMSHFMNRCSTVFAPTEEVQDYLRTQQISADVQVLPTGLDAASYVKDTVRSEKIRKQYGGTKPYLLCTVSRLDKEKNFYFLLRAVAELKKRIGDCFRLMIIGEGGERNRLQEYARELGLEETVVFVGFVPNTDVKHYLFASNLFLFTSKSETQGIVLAEAMAAGLPVAAVHACGTQDIVVDGINGYMTEESEEALAMRAAEILNSSELRKKMSEEALVTARGYHAEQIAFCAQQKYQQVLSERGEKFEGAMSHLPRIFKIS